MYFDYILWITEKSCALSIAIKHSSFVTSMYNEKLASEK